MLTASIFLWWFWCIHVARLWSSIFQSNSNAGVSIFSRCDSELAVSKLDGSRWIGWAWVSQLKGRTEKNWGFTNEEILLVVSSSSLCLRIPVRPSWWPPLQLQACAASSHTCKSQFLAINFLIYTSYLFPVSGWTTTNKPVIEGQRFSK